MKQPQTLTGALGSIAIAAAIALPATLSTQAAELEILTFNVWHGLRAGESNTRFPGEDEARRERRFAWQIEELKRLDPDVLLFQEVNPNARRSRRYAEALGYDVIHKVTSCGVHLPPIKIPANVNEGLAILARPELGLRRVGTRRLSGNAKCTATFGFQTKESRYVLFGEIEVEGRELLLATTHLSSPPFVPPGFEKDLYALTASGIVAQEQRDEIVEKLERKRARNLAETRKILELIEKKRARWTGQGQTLPVVFTGDFNTEPGTAAIVTVEEAGFRNAGQGPAFLTWDPVRNAKNHEIGAKRTSSIPTFDIPELEALLAPRETIARQIDFVFASDEWKVTSAEMVLDQPKDGIYPSDHFGVLARIRLASD